MGEWDYIPKQEIPKEKTETINCLILKYIQDLQQRDNIIFEVSPSRLKPNDKLDIGGGTQFYPKNKAYSINGKSYIVVTIIKNTKELIAGPDYRMGNQGYMHVSIYEKVANGQDKLLAVCRKETYYKNKSLLSSTYVFFEDEKLCYNIESSGNHYLCKEIPGEHALQEFPKTIDRVRDFSKEMVEPEIIDRLYELFKDKIRFLISSRVGERPGEHMVKVGRVEVGSWPHEGLTNISLEEMRELKEKESEILLNSMFKDPVAVCDNQAMTNK